MSIFGLYFASGLLRETGWPRRQGILRKKIIDTMVFDSIIDQMIDWAAALGAGRPRLALQIIAHMFRDKDWEGPDAPNIKQFVEEAKPRYRQRLAEVEDEAPHSVVQPVRLAKHYGSSIKADTLQDKRFSQILEQMFLEGLLYGLSSLSEFEDWYKAHLKDFQKKLPTYKAYGLQVDVPRSLSEYYSDSEQIIRDYEREVDPLPPIPPKLLSHAEALGLKL